MQTTSALFEKRATAEGTYWASAMSKPALRHYLRGLAVTDYKTAADVTSWWQRDEELRAYLHGVEPEELFKRAALGGEQEQGFEQAFSSLAYAYLKDKAPRLLDFIVGFQLVDRNEDNTKAVGIFGFKVGDQWLYAPVFFINGDLKGHELLYVKNRDAFVPMKENWVNSLISKRPHQLGEGSDQSTHELGGRMPNLMRLAHMPLSTKRGSADEEPLPLRIANWATPMLPLIGAMATKQAKALYPDHVKTAGALDFASVVAAPFTAALVPSMERFDLGRLLHELPGLKTAARKTYEAYPSIATGIDSFYGKDFFAKLDQEEKRAASFIMPPKGTKVESRGKVKPVKRPSMLLIDEAEKESFDKTAEIEVIALDVSSDEAITVNRPELTDAEREKLLNDTVLIKDKRDPHSDRASIAYNTQISLELVNPTETGLYDVLEKPGTFDQMLVVMHPQAGDGRKRHAVIIRKDSPRNWLSTHPTNVFVRQNGDKKPGGPTLADFRKYVDGLSSIDTLTEGGTYMALGDRGATCPFTVSEKYEDDTYKVSWKDDAQYGLDRPSSLPRVQEPRWSDRDRTYEPWSAIVRINRNKGCKLRSVAGELNIPEDYKILKLQDPPKPKKKDNDLSIMPCCEVDDFNGHGAASDKRPIQPGRIADIQLMLNKQAQVLKVHDTGAGEVWISAAGKQERMTKKSSLIALVRDYGFTEPQSRDMLKQAAVQAVHNRPVTFYVKYAYGYGPYGPQGLQPGPSAPGFPQPMTGSEPSGPGSVDAIYPQEEEQPVDSMSAYQTDPSVYDPYYRPDQDTMQVAQQAANSGQKEVFDTSMVSGLLKAVRQDSIVDRYLGDLMKSLDRLGRILFLFYWHNEEFEERYGRQDLPELEDSIRNAFETLGDVVLYLQEKTVQGRTGISMGSGVGVGGSSDSEPSVEQAARN